MFNFSYQNPTRIVFGEGQIKQLSALIPAGSKVVLRTYGGRYLLSRMACMRQVMQALQGL